MARRLALLVLASCSNAFSPPAQPVRHEHPAMNPATSRPAAATFAALDDDAATIPAGPSGAVGPSHLVAIAGNQLRIQSKTGTVLGTQPVATLFASLAHTAHAGGQVAYDALAGHWIVVANADGGAAVEIAVSATTDPTGTFHVFDLPQSAFKTTNVRVGYGGSMIVVTADLLDANQASQGARIYACTKQDLYDGTGATCRLIDRPVAMGDHGLVPAISYDADTEGTVLVERNRADGAQRISMLIVNGPVGAESVSPFAFDLNITLWDSTGPITNFGFAKQAGSVNRIDTGDDRIASAVLRNHHLWAAHTIYLPAGSPTRSAIQWFEVTPGQFMPMQQGRIDDPTGAIDYAYPSITVNAHDDALIAFGRFGAAIDPSFAFASRMHGDTTSSISPDTVARAGVGPYTKTHGGTLSLWGGAGGASVDPSDSFTMWALGEVAAAPTPAPCTIDCGNWTTQWVAMATDCAGVANGAPCDTDICKDGSQACNGGQCLGGQPAMCGADQECRVGGACDPVTGCSTQLAPDGSPCTEGICEQGFCQHFADDFFIDEVGDFFPPDTGHPFTGSGDQGGCCQTGGGGEGALLLALGVLGIVTRSRRGRSS